MIEWRATTVTLLLEYADTFQLASVQETLSLQRAINCICPLHASVDTTHTYNPVT